MVVGVLWHSRGNCRTCVFQAIHPSAEILLKPICNWIAGFFREDNGNNSSMRLVMIWTVCLVVPVFLVACIWFPHLKDMALTVFGFAGSLVGIKAAQKTTEKPTPPTE